jgi:hypothetical protein
MLALDFDEVGGYRGLGQHVYLAGGVHAAHLRGMYSVQRYLRQGQVPRHGGQQLALKALHLAHPDIEVSLSEGEDYPRLFGQHFIHNKMFL